jgi:phage tail sheath protein FI
VLRSGVSIPASSAIAGLINKIDNELGFWWSPSNHEINGIQGTARAIDYQPGDYTSRANLLNEQNIATIIRDSGFRLWGNRTLSSDPKYKFISVSRTVDMINDSIRRGHRWAVDRCITATYLEEVMESVRGYLRMLQSIGAILGGDVWVDPALNTAATISNGQVVFDFDFTPPFPAERVTFRSHLVDGYVTTLFR